MTITRQNLNRKIFDLSLPAMAENLLHTSVHIADALMISRLGTEWLAAVSLSGVLIWRVTFTLACIQAGTIAMVARYFGQKSFGLVKETVGQSLLLAIIIGLFTTIIGLKFSHFFLWAMGAKPEVIKLGVPYLQVIFAVSIFRIILYTGASSLRAAGDTKTPMKITLVMNIVNVLFNWLLIFGIWIFPRLELLGAGIASSLSIVVGSALILYVLFTGKSLIKINLKNIMTWNYNLVKKIIRISIPNGGEEILRTVGILAFMVMITKLGTITLAAHTIAVTIEMVSFMLGWGYAVAATTLVGQSLGQKDIGLAKSSFWRSAALAMVTMGVMGLFYALLPRTLVGVFKPEYEVFVIAIFFVQIMALEQPLLAMVMTVAGGIRGAGDTVSPMLTGVLGNVGVRVGLCYLLAFYLGLGYKGIYYGMVLDWVFRSVAILLFYKWGRWRRIKL